MIKSIWRFIFGSTEDRCIRRGHKPKLYWTRDPWFKIPWVYATGPCKRCGQRPIDEELLRAITRAKKGE